MGTAKSYSKDISYDNCENYNMPLDEAIELARSHHMIGNFVLAERTYLDILQTHPKNPTVNHLLGAMYYQLGNTDKASHYMKVSIDIESKEKQYWSNYGSVYLINKKFDEAIHCFDQALLIDPKHLESINRKSLTYWHKKEYEIAEKLAHDSLHIDPENMDGLINLGLSLSAQKKYKEAHDNWKKASRIYPNNAQIWSNWANMLKEIKRYSLAETTVRRALMISPNDTDALNNLGCIQKETGRFEEAVESFTKTNNIKPQIHEAHYNKASTLYDLGRFEEAVISARYAIDFKNDYSEAYNILSSSLSEIGEFEQAHFAAQKAIQIKPNEAISYINLADVLYLSGRFDDGHAALNEALKRDPNNPTSYSKLASVYERLDETELALNAIDNAIKLSKNNSIFYAKKASMLHIANDIEGATKAIEIALNKSPKLISALITKSEILIATNKIDSAAEVLEKAKSINPFNPYIYFSISNIKKFKTEHDKDYQTMLSIEQKSDKLGIHEKAALYFSLSRAHENLLDHKKSFEYLDKANKEKRKMLPYDRENQSSVFQRIKEEFSPKIIETYKGRGFNSDIPIFIVGMPRSGTTLTEQIISSHPEIYGAGELPDISRTKRNIGFMSIENVEEAGRIYIDFIKNRDKTGEAKRITDKMPGNYMNIGFILSILPNAKIVHCRRNIIDTCLSNYRQNFMVGQFWSYDLEELGEEYIRYLELMEYWQKQFPDRIFDIHYEDTVENLEKQARELLNFVDMPWNDACLRPHKQQRAILTASKTQVTKPIYKTSIKKWKQYEEELYPLIKTLKKSKYSTLLET